MFWMGGHSVLWRVLQPIQDAEPALPKLWVWVQFLDGCETDMSDYAHLELNNLSPLLFLGGGNDDALLQNHHYNRRGVAGKEIF